MPYTTKLLEWTHRCSFSRGYTQAQIMLLCGMCCKLCCNQDILIFLLIINREWTHEKHTLNNPHWNGYKTLTINKSKCTAKIQARAFHRTLLFACTFPWHVHPQKQEVRKKNQSKCILLDKNTAMTTRDESTVELQPFADVCKLKWKFLQMICHIMLQ